MLLKTPPVKRAKGPAFQNAGSSLDAIDGLFCDAGPNKEFVDYFFIIEEKRFIKIRFTDILSIEASRCYIIIHTLKGRHIVIGSMVQLVKRLPEASFCRIHRSWIVPLDGISEITRHRILVFEKWFPLGSSFRRMLLARLSPHVFNRRYLSNPDK
jgi:DNA-binding LytR/AlgR family response regulator